MRIALLFILTACATAPRPAPEPFENTELTGSLRAPESRATPDDPATREPRRAAERWLAAHAGTPIAMSLAADTPTGGLAPYCFFNASLTCPADRRDALFIYDGGDRRLTIGFRAIITPQSTLADLRQQLDFVSIDHLPPDGLAVPGWELTLQTPSSRIETGVEIVSFQASVITLRIRTPVFAIYGFQSGCRSRLMADAPTPPDCFFQIRRDMDIDLSVSLPMFRERRA